MGSPVTFIWPHGGSTKVELAGTFNGWKPVTMNPVDDHQLWQLELELPLGHHEFKFVVDGRWCHDPDQQNAVNDVGSLNNIVDVEDEAAVEDEVALEAEDAARKTSIFVVVAVRFDKRSNSNKLNA